MKYSELINYSKSIAFNNKDFEIEAIYFLIEEIMGISKSELILRSNEEIEKGKDDILKSVIEKYILENIPVQYIIGYAYFYGYKFKVNENVLIPRFDTEVLVESVIEEIKKSFKESIRIVDIGTGSGCIAITLFKELSNVIVDAIDISLDALDVAKKNSKLLEANISFIENNMLEGINTRYDVIISNPPYIDENEEIMDLVLNNEPKLALFSSDNGLYHYKTIIDQSLVNLKENGFIAFEIPDNKCDKIYEYANKFYKNIKVIKDYNNQRRVLIIRK